MKKHSITGLLSNPESRRRILQEAMAESGGSGLLDLIPAYGPDGEPLDAEKGWTPGERPEPEKIDYRRSSNDMILEGRAVLKDGRKIFWKRVNVD